MVITVTLWLPLICLLALTFLYPLRFYYRRYQTGQIYAAIFSFPGLASSLYILNIALSHGTIKSSTIHVRNIPIFLTLHISLLTSIILVLMFSTITLVIFLRESE